MINSENTHTNNFLQTEWVIFRNLYACTYKYTFAITIRGEKGLKCKGKSGRIYGRFGGRKEKKEML